MDSLDRHQIEIAYWRNQKLRNWRTFDYDHQSMKQRQATGYRSGEALQHHVDAVHHGTFTPTCQACREIKARETSCRK